MLRTDLGQSSSVVTISSDRLHQILRDLRLVASGQTTIWERFGALPNSLTLTSSFGDNTPKLEIRFALMRGLQDVKRSRIHSAEGRGDERTRAVGRGLHSWRNQFNRS